MTGDDRDSAMQGLETALGEQGRLSDLYQAAIGTSAEFRAYVSLRGASDEVAAREAWLGQIDQDGAGGRVWINGCEVGGTGSLFLGLEDSYD